MTLSENLENLDSLSLRELRKDDDDKIFVRVTKRVVFTCLITLLYTASLFVRYKKETKEKQKDAASGDRTHVVGHYNTVR